MGHREWAGDRVAEEFETIKQEHQKRQEEKEKWQPWKTETREGPNQKKEERIRSRIERQQKDHERREEIRIKIQRSIEKERYGREMQAEKHRRSGRGRGGEIVGSIFGILFGFYLIVQFPFGILSQSNPLFLGWLRMLGGLIILRNLWKAVQALIPFDRIWARRIVYALGELLGLLSIPLFLWLRDNISVVPAFSKSPQGLTVHEPSAIATEILFWVFTGIIILTVIGVVIGFIKSFAMKEYRYDNRNS